MQKEKRHNELSNPVIEAFWRTAFPGRHSFTRSQIGYLLTAWEGRPTKYPAALAWHQIESTGFVPTEMGRFFQGVCLAGFDPRQEGKDHAKDPDWLALRAACPHRHHIR